MNLRSLAVGVLLLAAAAGGAWFYFGQKPRQESWLGYADADFVKIAPTQTGRLVSLDVGRGDEVAAGATLFTQDDVDDRASRDQAKAALDEAAEKLADLRAPARGPEVMQAQAEVTDMQAAFERVSRDLTRNEATAVSGATTRQTLDQLRADTRSADAKLRSAQARLALAIDPSGRQHAIAAQVAAVAAAEATLASAQWRLDQRLVTAPAAGLVADTYARPGETIAAGGPVVSLLPPGNILVRFYVTEPALARVHPGQQIRIACDSCRPGMRATISFVATAPEYTPPVIYSEGARGSLVYLVEAHPDPATRPLLKPGQPLDVFPPDRTPQQ